MTRREWLMVAVLLGVLDNIADFATEELVAKRVK